MAGGLATPDGATFVSLTGSLHREDEPAHMTILDPAACLACEAECASSCNHGAAPRALARRGGDPLPEALRIVGATR